MLVITIWYEVADVVQLTVPVSVTPPEQVLGLTEAENVVPRSETVDVDPHPPVLSSVARIRAAWRRWVATSPSLSEDVIEVVASRLTPRMSTIATRTSTNVTPCSPASLRPARATPPWSDTALDAASWIRRLPTSRGIRFFPRFVTPAPCYSDYLQNRKEGQRT
jgi:hypothetical protein